MTKKSKKDVVVTHDTNYMEQNNNLPRAIIVDIDGTVALIQNRSPFDATKWHQDIPHVPIVNLIFYIKAGIMNIHNEGTRLIFITGREGGALNYANTRTWLEIHTSLPSEEDLLLMRAPGDYRGDADVKRELFDKHVRDRYNILWVLEDRNKMVNFWRNEIKLPTLQVKDGDY